METLFRGFVRHGTAANILMVLALAAGLWAASAIRTQFFPDVVVENVTVRVTHDGAGPADVDRGVIAVLEPVLRAVDGVDETRTIAREGSASIVVEFEPGAPLERITAEVEAAVDGVDGLPEDAEEPTVSRGRFRDRVTNIIVSGPVDRRQLTLYAEELRQALFDAGVTRVEIEGAPNPVIRVAPDPAALERYGLGVTDVADRVRADADARPVGALGPGDPRLRAGADRDDVARLAEIVVARGADGARVRLGDIAAIGFEDASSGSGAGLGPRGEEVFFSGGDPAVRLRVDRDAGGDAVKIQAAVETVVAEVGATLPDGVSARLAQTRAQAISDRLDILIRNGGVGLLIVVTLLFLFLNARTALWVAAGVPTAMLATIALMQLSGLSLNMLSLFALIICLGIVVDDAIVVGEHADRLHRDGLSPENAATAAATRMAAPVFSASVTTIIAFGGLVLISGRFGDFVADIPLTVIALLTASLIECFLILPAHMRHALAGAAKERWYDAPSRTVNRGFEWVRERVFRPFMGAAMSWRYPVLGAAIGLLLSAATLRVDGTVPWFFFNAPERGTLRANVAMLPGAGREETAAMLDEMRRALDAVDAAFAEEHGRGPVKDSVFTLGGGAGRGLSVAETKDPDQLGGVEVELIDPDLRPYSAFDFIRAWREEIQQTPGVERLAFRGDRSGPSGEAIEVALAGADDPESLKAAAEAVIAALERLPGVSALEDSLPYDRPELTVRLTPKGEALGFTASAVSSELRGRLEGIEAASFPDGAREQTVDVRLADNDVTAAFPFETRLAAPAGGVVALGDIARIEESRGFASIRRENGRIIVAVTGDVIDDPGVREDVATALDDQILPDVTARFGVAAAVGGVTEQERRFLGDALFGFGAALAGIYVTLAWIFASWTRPLVVVLAIPFGVVGAIWGHHLHDTPMSMFSVIGLIGLAGIIINDSIVLVTAIDEKAKRRPLREAVIDGACDRLRAVFLTTATTVGGLAPMLFETSRQALFLKPTVITLAYGLAFGMLIVLLVTPAMILAGRDLSAAFTSFRRMAALGWRRRPALGGGRTV